jgi:hypothetical protein
VLASLSASSNVRSALPHPSCLPSAYKFVSCLHVAGVFGLPRTCRIRPCVVGFHAQLCTGKLLLQSLRPCAYAGTQLAQSFSYELVSARRSQLFEGPRGVEALVPLVGCSRGLPGDSLGQSLVVRSVLAAGFPCATSFPSLGALAFLPASPTCQLSALSTALPTTCVRSLGLELKLLAVLLLSSGELYDAVSYLL